MKLTREVFLLKLNFILHRAAYGFPASFDVIMNHLKPIYFHAFIALEAYYLYL